VQGVIPQVLRSLLRKEGSCEQPTSPLRRHRHPSQSSINSQHPASTMTSMEDLIATISGGMHVSQDGYDLKALQVSISHYLPHLQYILRLRVTRAVSSRSPGVPCPNHRPPRPSHVPINIISPTSAVPINILHPQSLISPPFLLARSIDPTLPISHIQHVLPLFR